MFIYIYIRRIEFVNNPGSAVATEQVDAHHAEKSYIFDPQHDTPLVDATRLWDDP